MARSVKKHAVRRNEILDVAQKLVYSRGYEQMTIQDILDEVGVSKGAFYHYFGSKQALLEALVERILDEAERLVLPIVQDPHLPALEKLQRYFSAAARWKTEQKAYLLALLQVWYADDNAIVREKVHATAVKRIAPLLTAIVRQGIQEGALTTSHPDHISEAVLCLVQGVGDAFAEALLSSPSTVGNWQNVESTVAAYTEALERVLGAPSGSLVLVDAETQKAWFSHQETTHTTSGEKLAEKISAPGLRED